MRLKLADSLVPIDLIVFDCDGVLLDTMPQKIEAFRQWIPEAHSERSDEFMSHIMSGFGRSRTHHVRHFYESLLGREVEDSFIDEEVRRFTGICEPLCAEARWRTGSRDFVEACREAGALRYVLSGTPQIPLEAMLASAGASSLFDHIIGSPPAKPESMERILRETATTPDRCVFIGDANADHEAALHVGAHFVYFPSEARAPESAVQTTVHDLRELLDTRSA